MYRTGAVTSLYTYYYVMVPMYCVFHTHDHFSTHGVRGQRARYLVWKRTASHLFHGLLRLDVIQILLILHVFTTLCSCPVAVVGYCRPRNSGPLCHKPRFIKS